MVLRGTLKRFWPKKDVVEEPIDPEAPESGDRLRSGRRVAHYARPYWKLVIASVVIVFFGAASSLLQPWPLKILVDNVLGQHPLPSWLAGWLGPIAEDRHSLLLFSVLGGLAVTILFNAMNVAENYVN